MKKLLLPVFIFGMSAAASAQNMRPLYEAYFSHPDDMENNEDGPGYHFKIGDSLMVSMSDDGYYKLITKSGQVLEEGDTDEGDNAFLRHGTWTEYYRNGKTRMVGNYFLNKPYGHWKFFNESGNPVSECDVVPIITADGTTAYCKAGLEVVYFSDGKIKEERYYIAEPYDEDSRVKVEDPETGKASWKTIKVQSYRSKAFGTWVYYNEDGTVDKREDKKG